MIDQESNLRDSLRHVRNKALDEIVRERNRNGGVYTDNDREIISRLEQTYNLTTAAMLEIAITASLQEERSDEVPD